MSSTPLQDFDVHASWPASHPDFTTPTRRQCPHFLSCLWMDTHATVTWHDVCLSPRRMQRGREGGSTTRQLPAVSNAALSLQRCSAPCCIGRCPRENALMRVGAQSARHAQRETCHRRVAHPSFPIDRLPQGVVYMSLERFLCIPREASSRAILRPVRERILNFCNFTMNTWKLFFEKVHGFGQGTQPQNKFAKTYCGCTHLQ